MATGAEAAHTGVQYEGVVWRQVLHRLDRRSARRPGDPAYAGTIVVPKPRTDTEVDDPELDEIRNIVSIRHKMAERLASFSEDYREEVWDQLQTRISEPDEKKGGWFGFLKRGDAKRHPNTGQADDAAEDLVQTVNARRQLAQRRIGLADQHRDDIWQRVRTNITARDVESQSRSSNPFSRRWVLAAAAAALVVAALGPIPATGFAHHPAVDAVRFAGEHLGVMESDSPPTAADVTDTVSPVAATPESASNVLGFTVTAPAEIPGFVQTSSQLYPSAVTASSGGMFVLTYEDADASRSLAIYQEPTSGTDLAVVAGSVSDVTLSDGTAATYFEGAWDMAGAPAWEAGGTQTLVFERGDVRAVVRYTGPAMDQAELISIADLV